MSDYPFFRHSLSFCKSPLSLAFLGCVSVISLVQADQTDVRLPKGFSKHAIIVHIPGRQKKQVPPPTDIDVPETPTAQTPEDQVLDNAGSHQNNLNSGKNISDDNQDIHITKIAPVPDQLTAPDAIPAPPVQPDSVQQNSTLSPHLMPEKDIQQLLRQQRQTKTISTSAPQPTEKKADATKEAELPDTAITNPNTTPPLPPRHTRHLNRKRSQQQKRSQVKSQPVKPVSLGTKDTQFFASLAAPRPTYQARDDLSQPKQQADASAPAAVTNATPAAVSPPPDINPGKRQAILVQSQKKVILQAWIQGPKGQLVLPQSCETELKEIIGQKKAPDWFATVCALDDILYVSIQQSKYLKKQK